jgi:hypothetical protein
MHSGHMLREGTWPDHVAGGPSLHCTIPTAGAPSLRFFARVGGDAAGTTLVRSTPRCVCRRRTRPFRLREGRGTRICGGCCSLKAGPPAPPTLRFPERTGVALRSDLAHDDRQKVNFLFRLYQPRNNRSKFIEYLVPALHLTAIFRALHGFISNEGKFRLAVSEILKDGHVVRTVYSLMFYS